MYKRPRMDNVYLCLKFDKNGKRDSISTPIFWPTYTSAKNFAVTNAKIIRDWTSPYLPDFPPKTFVFYYKIFELPYGIHVVIDDTDAEYGHYEMYQNHIETVYDPETTAAMIIQKHWRMVYNRRFVAAVIIKRELRKAIANPYTELCKRRLLREFSEMGQII